MNQTGTRAPLAAATLATLFIGAACSNTPQVRLPELLNPGTPVSTSTPTVTPSPTPTPTPTPIPAEVVSQGERDLHNGDWDAAMSAFELVITNAGATPEEMVEAQLGLAHASLRRGDFGSAKAVLDTVLNQYADHPMAAQAYFLRGDAKMGVSDWEGAIADFETYLSLRPGLIDSYVYERIADCQLSLEQADAAVASYEQAASADRDLVGLLQLHEKIAAVYRSLGNVEAAVEHYQSILGTAENPAYRATIEFFIGQAYLEAGQTEAAYEQLNHVVMTYPESFEALSALRALLDVEYPVDQFQRGVVNYNQGQFDIALEAFYNYLAGTSIDYPPDAHLYIARSYRRLGNPQAALSELQALIQRWSVEDGAVWADAHLELADTYAASGDPGTAFTTYDAFVEEHPDLPQAADALFDAALLAESLDDTARAIAYYQRLASEYPADPRAAEALFRGAMDAYLAGDYPTAEALFGEAAAVPANERPAASHFWLGKSYQAEGQTEQATAAFDSAVAADDGRYYALRAREIREGEDAFTPPAAIALPSDPDMGRLEAEEWLVQSFGLAETPPLAETLRADLSTDTRLLRGRELWELGLLVEGRTHFEAVRADHQEDPLAMYQLAIYFRDIGLYRSSILAAWRVMQLAEIDPLDAPAFLTRLRNPTYFSDLVLASAEQYDLDPLWIYALMWQESVFEGFAVSTALAQGLMQVWPPTGEDIAARLNWPSYRPADLQRPYVNVAFGTWLLRDELDRFDDNKLAALTAYNAGPGNTAAWVEASRGDPDLFVESITIAEPKTYVQRIYEHYEVYRALYGNP